MDRNSIVTVIFNFMLPVLAFLVFYITGKIVERRHLKRLDEAEARLSHIRVEPLKTLPQGWAVTAEPVLVYGSVVLANDHFKVFISALKKIVGGRLGEYERLMARGRREAIVRMKQMAEDHGCNVVWNMRVETSMLTESQKGASSAELYAYGTAMRVEMAL